MKVLCAIMIVLCSGLIGIELYRRQVSSRDMLGEMQSLCLHMMCCVRYERTEPEMIIYTFADSGDRLTRLCRGRLDDGKSFAEAWKYMAEHPLTALFDAEERALIEELGLRFGRSDAEGELVRLQHIYERLCRMYQRRCDNCILRSRMYITAGFLAGMLITIFMI